MRSQTERFSSSLMNTQFDTSAAVRPQPLQTSSKSVEQTPMQGLSGSEWRLEAIECDLKNGAAHMVAEAEDGVPIAWRRKHALRRGDGSYRRLSGA